MFKEVIRLISTSSTPDQDGFNCESENEIEVFADKKSVSRNEFYSSMQAGLKPSIIFVVMQDDYELTKRITNNKAIYADKVKYEDALYEIIRTYSKNNTYLELVCG